MTILLGHAYAGGLPITGTLFLRPSRDALQIGGACGHRLSSRTPPFIFNLVNGVITGPGAAPYSVPGADCLTPAGITYNMTITGPSGAILVDQDGIAITGTYYNPFHNTTGTPPPPPAAARWIRSGAQGLSFDAPRVYTLEGPYATGLWTFEFDASHDGTKINNGNKTAADGAGLTTAAPGGPPAFASAALDLGGGVTKAFGRFDLWTDAPLTAMTVTVDYSDDGASWPSALTTSFGNIGPTAFWQDAPVGGVYPSHVEIPSGIGAHRYWRLLFYSGLRAINVYEIQASTFALWSGNAALGDTVEAYEIIGWPGGGLYPTYDVPDPLQPTTLETASLPTDAATLAMPAAVQAPIPAGTYPIVQSLDTGGGGFTIVTSGAVRTRSQLCSSYSAIPFYSMLALMP